MATALLRRDPAAPRSSALDFLNTPDSPAGAFLDAPDGAPVQPQEFDPETAYYGDFASLGNNLTADQLARAKQRLMAPLIKLPTMPDLSAMPAPQTPFDTEPYLTPAQTAGVYNAVKGPVEELSSPFNLGIMGATMGLGTAAAAGSIGAKAALVGTGATFGALAAVDTVKLVQQAREVLANPATTEQQRTQAATAPVVSGLMGLAALAGAGRLAAGEAIPRINAAYPEVFWKKSGLTAEQFAAEYPAAVRRVAGVGGEKPTPADVALVQQINEAAEAAGVNLLDVARGRIVAENITWEPRAVQAIIPESLLPTQPTSSLSFRATGKTYTRPARQPVSPVAASASEPTLATPAARAPSAMLFLDAPLAPAPVSPVPPRPVAPSVSVAPVPPSAPAQVAPPEPLPAPVDNAPVVAPPAGALVLGDRGLLYDAQVESDSKVKPGQQLRAVPSTPETRAHAIELFQTLQDGDQILTADGMLFNVERNVNKLSGVTSILLVTESGSPIEGIARTPRDNQGRAVPGVTRLDVDNNYRSIIQSGKIIRKPKPAEPPSAPETPPAPVTVPPAAPPSAPGFPAAVVSTGTTSRPAPLTTPPAAPEVKPSSRRQIAAQRAEIRRLTKLADQAAQSSPERAGQYTAQAQQAREQLAEMESNTITGPTPQVGPDPLGNADLLTQIADYVGKINMTPPANNVGGEYDGLAAAFSRGAARLLRSSKGGANIVNAIEELNAAAGTKFESPSQFFEAVDRAVSNRQNVARDLDRQAYRDKVEGMAQTDTKKGRPRALVPSTPNVIDQVGVGGEFKLNKEKFSVVDTDEGPGGIILYIIQDGHRFTIPEGTPIYPDKGSLKIADVAPQKPAATGPQSDDPFGDNFVPEPDAAPAAPAPGPQADLVAGIERQAAAPALTLESASVGQQAAEAQAAREAQLVAKRRADMLAANDQPLTGDSSNVNQGQLYAADADMFSGASAQEMAAQTPAAPQLNGDPAALPSQVMDTLHRALETVADVQRIIAEQRGGASGYHGKQTAKEEAPRLAEAEDVIAKFTSMAADNGFDAAAVLDNLATWKRPAPFAPPEPPKSPQSPRRGSSAVGDPGPLEPGMPPIPPGVPAGNLNYGRMPVAMERIAPGTVDVPTVLDALRAVARAAGSMTDIREGRFSQKALGIAKSWSEIIRLRQLNNLPTAAHEVGHIVSKAIFGSMKSKPMMRQAFPAPVIKELQAMGKALYGSTKPVAGYTAEGFAELVRLWLSTEDAARRAPLATKWLEETLFPLQSAKGSTPSLGQAMRYARDQFDLWRSQGAEGRIGAQTKDEPGRWQRVKTWAKENLSGRAVGEEFAPLEELAKAYTTTTGNRLAPGENPYMIATALRGTAGAKLETWVDHAMTDLNGTVTGPSLREAVAPVRAANAEKFQLYLTVRQAIERLKQGKNPGLEPEDLVYVRDKYEKAHPEFIAAAEGMADWWAGVLNYLEQAWPEKNSKVIAAVRAANPRYFGPLARVLDPARVRPAAADSVGGGIHRFKGSGLPIKKLLLQSLYVAEGMIAQAHRDAIARSVFRLAEVEGMGWIIEEVPITKAMEQVNIEKLRSQLEALGVDTSAIAPDEMLSYATMRDTPTGIDPIIALDTANGKRWFQVPAMVFEILEGVQEPARLGAVFEIFAGVPARAFKLGTTGVRASFSLVTNPLRDLPTFMLQSIAGNPASRVANYLGALAGIVKAGLGGNQSPAAELAHLLGLQSSTFLGGDIAQAKRTAKGLFHGKFYRRITSPVETLREILSFTETSPRLAELEMIGRELGWKPGQPLTRDQAVAMMVAFKRVTTDFAAKGSKWRALYRSVPFANAAVQGTRAFGRAFSRDQGTKEKHYAPLRAVLNGLTLLTLPALWNYWANKDEEWFKMLPYRERYLYLNVSAGRNVYQIPLPPEWAATFATLPIAALDAWYHNDRKALVAALDHVLSVVNPLDYPVLAKVAKEQWSNKIEFFNRPIVPRGELDLLAGSQRGIYTSEIGNELGNIFPNQISPRRFDAAVRAVFGGVGGDVIDAPGALMRALGLKTQIANREMELSDIPVFGRLARRGGQFSAASQPLTEFWDDYNRYSAWKASNHKALVERTPVLEPMPFKEQAYAMKLALLEPYIKLRMEIAARTPELDKRQAIYQATSERAQKLLESRPTSK